MNPWALLRSRTISEDFLLPPFWWLVTPSSVDLGLMISFSPSVVGWMFNLVLSKGVRVEKVGLRFFPIGFPVEMRQMGQSLLLILKGLAVKV